MNFSHLFGQKQGKNKEIRTLKCCKSMKNRIFKELRMLSLFDVYSYYIWSEIFLDSCNIKFLFHIMRLRHKKPINSYKGQVSHDSNENYDEDFEKNLTPPKKMKQYKTFTSPDPLRQNASILASFINSMNEDYRQHLKKFSQGQPIQSLRESIEGEVVNKKSTRTPVENNSAGKQLNAIKQQYNFSKKVSEQKKSEQRDGKEKKIKTLMQGKKKLEDNSQKVTQNKINKTMQNNPLTQNNSKVQQETKPKPQQALPKFQEKKPNPMQANTSAVPNAEKPKTSQPQPQTNFQSPYMLNFPNNMFQLNQQPFAQLQLQMQMYPSLLAMMGNNNKTGIPLQFQQMQLQSLYNQMNYTNNYVPFSSLPFLNQNGYQQQNLQNLQNLQNSQFGTKQTTSHSGVGNKSQRKDESIGQKKQQEKIQSQKQIRVDRGQEQKIHTKKQEDAAPPPPPPPQALSQAPTEPNELIQQPPDFKKCASYHVAIAYNIHYHELKKKGRIPKTIDPNQQDLDEIDPTFHAKKVRQRKKSDNISGIDIVGNCQ